MNVKNFFVGATIGVTSFDFSFVGVQQEALACKTGLSRLDPTCPGRPFGRPLEDSESCLQVISSGNRYKITNRLRHSISYSVNGQIYELDSGYERTHNVGGGTNSCNAEPTNATVIFDSSYSSGSQNINYSLTESGSYYFSSSGNSIQLYRQ